MGFEQIYREAYAKGLKGCTTFRPNALTGQVLTDPSTTDSATPCCNIERLSIN